MAPAVTEVIPVNALPSPASFVASTLPNEAVDCSDPLIFVESKYNL